MRAALTMDALFPCFYKGIYTFRSGIHEAASIETGYGKHQAIGLARPWKRHLSIRGHTPHTNPSKHGRNTESQHRTNKQNLEPFLYEAYQRTIAPLSHPGSYQILLFTSKERRAKI